MSPGPMRNPYLSGDEGLEAPSHHRASAVDASHAEVFDFEEFFDAVFRAFAADAAFLHAAKGSDLGRDDAFVHADDAVFERLIVGLEAVEGCHRAEGRLEEARNFLAHNRMLLAPEFARVETVCRRLESTSRV